MKITLDTNLLIYFLEGIEPEANRVERLLKSFVGTENEGFISTISVAEILTGFYKAGDAKGATKVKKQLSDLTLNYFKIIPVTFEIADLAANLRAKRGGKLPDAIIIATALNQKCAAVYSQNKDFNRFNNEIKIYELT